MAGKAKAAGEGKPSALEAFLADTNKEFGAGSVMSLNDGAIGDIERISTGSIALDLALSGGQLPGGLPRGRIVEIYGPESCGKTTVSLQAAAVVQRLGGVVAFIDAEYALDADYCRSIGIDTDRLFINQPNSGEQGLQIANRAVRSGAFDLIIVDSVAALVPQAEIDGEIGDSRPGAQARLMSQALRMMVNGFNDQGDRGKKAVCIFINQLREKIGVTFGSPETRPGGKALKFYASVTLDVRRIETLGGHAAAYGNRLKVKVTKNKTAPPFRTAEFDLLFGKGISREGELVDLGVQLGCITKTGAFYRLHPDAPAVQGRDNARDWLIANPAVTDQLEAAVRAALASGASPAPVELVTGNPFS
jgi:recombination protein RecA